jgi:hypothetical protein
MCGRIKLRKINILDTFTKRAIFNEGNPAKKNEINMSVHSSIVATIKKIYKYLKEYA